MEWVEERRREGESEGEQIDKSFHPLLFPPFFLSRSPENLRIRAQ